MYLQPVRDFNMLECLQSYEIDSRFSLLCHFKYKCCETDRRCAKADFRICCLAFSTKHFNTGGTAKYHSAKTRHIYKEGAKNQIYETNVALLFSEILSSWRSAKYVKYIHRNLLPCFSSLRGWQCKIYIFHWFPNKQLGEHIWKLHQDAMHKLLKGWRALLKYEELDFISRIQKFLS